MKSLYDSLHLVDPKKPDVKPTPVPASFSVKTFSLDIVRSVEFRQYIINGLTLGDLPAAVVCKIIDHATELGELPTAKFDGMTVDQLEERAIRTLEVLRQLRRTNDVADSPSVEESPPTSVH